MTANKSEVKRYNITTDKYDHPVPYETEHGRWVEYSSYKTLQAECENLRKDAERYRWLRDSAILDGGSDYHLPEIHAWEYYNDSRPNVQHDSLDKAIDSEMKEKSI